MVGINLEDEETKLIIELENERARFYDMMNRENIVNFMKSTIDNIDGIDFINPRARRYINLGRPRFPLKMTDDFINKYPTQKEIKIFIHDEVILKYMKWVETFISKNIDVSDMLDKLRITYGKDNIKNHIVDVMSSVLADIEKKELAITLMI